MPKRKTIYTMALNVRDFGATGGDTTDDTAAIQAAVNALPAGGAVYLPSGQYRYSAPVTVRANDVVLYGDGSATVLTPMNGTTPQACFIVGTQAGDAQRCAIRDLRINGSYAGQHGIIFRSNSGRLERLIIYEMAQDGIRVEGFGAGGVIFEVLLHDLQAQVCGRYPVYLDPFTSDGEAIRVIAAGGRLLATPRGQDGIFCAGGAWKFVACHSYSNVKSGLRLDSNQEAQVLGGAYENNTEYGIIAYAYRGVQIQGVSAYLNALPDIYAAGQADVLLGTSRLYSNAYASVHVVQPATVTLGGAQMAHGIIVS